MIRMKDSIEPKERNPFRPSSELKGALQGRTHSDFNLRMIALSLGALKPRIKTVGRRSQAECSFSKMNASSW